MEMARSNVTISLFIAVALIAMAAYVSSRWLITAPSPLAMNTLCSVSQTQDDIYFISCGGIY